MGEDCPDLWRQDLTKRSTEQSAGSELGRESE
jgi:hypothetical protein